MEHTGDRSVCVALATLKTWNPLYELYSSNSTKHEEHVDQIMLRVDDLFAGRLCRPIFSHNNALAQLDGPK